MGNVMRDALWRRRTSVMSGNTQMEACAASRNRGDLGCPRSAGCSRMYSAPASRAAESKAVVRRTISLASASSLRCASGTSGLPRGCSRVRTTGGPPSDEASERKWRDTEKVEHGGEATTAA
eukprot:6193933-Pleurochrysis_carterae.AAC.1